MKISSDATGIEARFFPPFKALLATYLPALTFLLGTVVVHEVLGVDFGTISRDPAAELMTISHEQAESMALPLIGMQSNIGGLVWFMGAVSGLLALALLRRKGELWTTPRGRFLTVMTLLSLTLGFDDVFMVHDGLGPQYLKLDEEPFILMYIVTALLVTVVFWRVILRLEPAMLALAVGGLAGSVLVDHFQEQLSGFSYRIFFEDGFKFLGIVGWAGYLTRQAWLVLTAEPATVRVPAAVPDLEPDLTGNLVGNLTGYPTGSSNGYPTGSSNGYPTGSSNGYPTGSLNGNLNGYPTGSPTGDADRGDGQGELPEWSDPAARWESGGTHAAWASLGARSTPTGPSAPAVGEEQGAPQTALRQYTGPALRQHTVPELTSADARSWESELWPGHNPGWEPRAAVAGPAPAPLVSRPHRRHRASTPAGRPVLAMAMILFGVLAVMGVIALSIALIPKGEVRILITWGASLAAAVLIIKGALTLGSRR